MQLALCSDTQKVVHICQSMFGLKNALLQGSGTGQEYSLSHWGNTGEILAERGKHLAWAFKDELALEKQLWVRRWRSPGLIDSKDVTKALHGF